MKKENTIRKALKDYNEELFAITNQKEKENNFKELWEAAQRALFAISNEVKFRW